ncbi:hypothetical protein E2562_013916 [Oryza meyeriana var. granulata]|uniref:1-phosphatidylinositol-3-phosphate 5-kinase n=1 Tax=Oryza meyeriana var. granulata TaxID=110450 RepID=A0A6G1C5T9_9ORYZ|nr:hypothetical protein E2562_013916 [Oryza meyeriana var. granulata]
MLGAMNGQLNILASRFLASAGVKSEWLDVATSLSWEAALLIQPHACTAGNDMDPVSYVKLKCVASGTRRQCEVVKGLVFRKNAAHKHMPTKCHSPRLLLIQGALGVDSHLGFSSFDSMEQDKENLRSSIAQMIQICRPNVVMVEKTVSRDIQELLLQHGVTLLLDMKLHLSNQGWTDIHQPSLMKIHETNDVKSNITQECLLSESWKVKQIRHGKEVKLDLMVMENLLFGHKVSRIYDLKGVVFSRYVSDSNDHDIVYLDQNFVDDMRVSPIYVGGRMKHLLQRAIWNDTAFLTSINVMDYSLLVGVDKEKHEFVFGIIDYLRQYTWDKQLETWVKTSLVVPKNSSPTV